MIYIYINLDFCQHYFFQFYSGDTWRLSTGYWCVVWFGGACELSAPPPKQWSVCIWWWVAMNVFKFGGILLYIARILGASKMMVCSICFFFMFHKDIHIANLGDWWRFVKLRWLKLLMVKRQSDMENLPLRKVSYISAGAVLFPSVDIYKQKILVILFFENLVNVQKVHIVSNYSCFYPP